MFLKSLNVLKIFVEDDTQYLLINNNFIENVDAVIKQDYYKYDIQSDQKLGNY